MQPRRVIVIVVVVAVAVIAGLAFAVTRFTGAVAAAPTPSATPVVVGTVPAKASTAPPPSPSSSSSARPTASAALDGKAVVQSGLTARVASLKAVTGKASGPGEVDGPALRVEVRITNGTARAVDLSNAVVGLTSGADGAPAPQLQASGGHAFPQRVDAGQSASGVFVFTVPASARKSVQITLDLAVDVPLVVFRGAAPR